MLPKTNSLQFTVPEEGGYVVSQNATDESAEVQADIQSENQNTLQLVSFQLADEEYGVEIMKVQEIILMGEITRVPQTPAYIKGLINLRSTVIPVVDLRLRFGLNSQEATENSRIMVVNVRGKTIGIVVDSVSEVLRVAESDVADPLPTVSGVEREYIPGLINLDSRLLVLLDIDKLLTMEEANSLDELIPTI
ncbi:MAG: chemotaxis protein CheW [Pirellulaceae bacterium]|nr:chemotaxis protein CheW [Pirellulaceae bacterium]